MNTPTKITLALIGSEVAVAAAVALGGGHMTGVAYADPGVTVTVDSTDYPLCELEDCSDQPNQVGVWSNDGRDWLIVGDNTYPIQR